MTTALILLAVLCIIAMQRWRMERRRADEYKALYLSMIDALSETALERFEFQQLNVQLAQRVAAQSALLSRRAERVPSEN